MPEEHRPRLPDDAPPVPPVGEDDGSDEPAGDDSDLPTGFADEPTGGDLLDDRTSEGDEVETLEDDVGSEDGWTEDSDAEDGGEEDDAETNDSEYGWTDDTDTPGIEDWDEALLPDAGPEDGPPDADGGEEGVDEPEVAPDELEPAPLDELTEEDEEDEGHEAIEEDSLDEPDWRLPPPADPSSVLVRHLGPSGQGVTGVATLAGEVWAAGGEVFVVRGDRIEHVDDPALDAIEAQSVALCVGEDTAAVVLGGVLGGCLVRQSPQAGFVTAGPWPKGQSRCAVTVFAHGKALYARTSDGLLFGSEDAGLRWTSIDVGGRCVGAATDGRCLVAIVTRPGEPPRLARSEDAGATFQAAALPIPAGVVLGPDVSVSVAGDRVLVASEEIGSALSSADGGRTFVRWNCPVSLAGALHPGDPATAFVSLFHAAEDQGALAVTHDGGRTFSTLVEMAQLRRVFRLDETGDPDGDNRIHAIVLDPALPGQVYLASAAGVFVVAMRRAA